MPETKPGWYRIKAKNVKSAKIVGPAEINEIEEYLKHFDRIHVVLVMRKGNLYLAQLQKSNKLKLPTEVLVEVLLPGDQALEFDRVTARFDGGNFWFEDIDPSNDATKGEYLREALKKRTTPEKISYSGLTFEEKAAYAIRHQLDGHLKKEMAKDDLKSHVEHAGGKYIRHDEKSDFFSITYAVDGQEYTSVISKDPTHRVITAGICLTGEDRNFDMKSLITVVREGQHRGLIHRFHDNPHANDDDHWDDTDFEN